MSTIQEEKMTLDYFGLEMPNYKVNKRDGSIEPLSYEKIRDSFIRAGALEEDVSLKTLCKETFKNIFDGVTTDQIQDALILSASTFIERDPGYSRVSARLYLQKIYREVIGKSLRGTEKEDEARRCFIENIKLGVENGLLDARMLEFNLELLASQLDFSRDLLFEYIGMETLYERYFLHLNDRVIETPQAFWMRAAMGLALLENDKNHWANEFYQLYSQLLFVSSTPTLFHSGLKHPQLSSCYLSTVNDDLTHIFKVIGDNAQLSKWSGGIGNDWTNIRATGAKIKSTNVESQGVIPFLKIANDATLAINRSGKRRGATCAYLETWHLDIEDFLDLRRNTGDERRRTHDMNTANWIPDLFMKRVQENGKWTLFSPDEVPDLHELYGKAFEERYTFYEQQAKEGKIRLYREVEALALWRKMLTRLFETGHPWITFKDPSNIRSPQDHVGVVHNSNLCTEITLNNSAEETAVCNLGSVNLATHIKDGALDHDQLQKTVHVAMRMLDNVIDINFYPTIEAKTANLRHRAVGLGLMGLQDALFKLRIPFQSEDALDFTDQTMEFISYHAILASSLLAKEKGAYSSYQGSKWDRGLLPQDTLELLEKERGIPVDVKRGGVLDWTFVRESIRKYGMRNSNCTAIAPTATISNIAGCYPSIEPIYKNIYVKSNMSGEFTVVNEYLVNDLKQLKLWTPLILDQLKFYDGNLEPMNLPQNIKDLYKEAFEIDPVHMLDMTARRAKWVDQSQSHNVFMKGASGKKLEEIYMAAWKKGLKTTYYLRTLAASQIEKSTLDTKYGFTQKRQFGQVEPGTQKELEFQTFQPDPHDPFEKIDSATQVTKVCSLLDSDCESCQ